MFANVVLFVFLLAAHPSRAAEQSVRIEVASEWRPNDLVLEVETVWLGEERALTLVNDGSVAGDTPGDEVWVGIWEGGRVRSLQIRLFAQSQDFPRTQVGGTTEPIHSTADTLSWVLQDGPQISARRTAAALPMRKMGGMETSGMAALFGWAGLVLAYVIWLVGRASGGRRG